VATWEREIMLERQREGIAKSKAEGKYKRRKPMHALYSSRFDPRPRHGER
jgi:DNA invertase Pin-like site-specific DNA recombinase